MSVYGFLLSAGGGAPTPEVVTVTYEQAQALIGTAGVEPGVVYKITNATHANGGRGAVYVQAHTTNSFYPDGLWEFDTFNVASGAFQFHWTTGQQRKIKVDGVDICSAITWATSQTNSFNLLVAAINANSGTSGYRAVVVFDTGLATADNGVCVALFRTTAAAITTEQVISVTNESDTPIAETVHKRDVYGGTNTETLTFPCIYNFTANQLYYVKDTVMNVEYSVTASRIVELGYNPIYNFNWRALYRTTSNASLAIPIARNVNFEGVGWLNVGGYVSFSNEVVFRNCIFKNSRFENRWLNGAQFSGLFIQFACMMNRPGIITSSSGISMLNNVVNNFDARLLIAVNYVGNNATHTNESFTAITRAATWTATNSTVVRWVWAGMGGLQNVNYTNGLLMDDTYNYSGVSTPGVQLSPNIKWTPSEIVIATSFTITSVLTNASLQRIPSGAYLVEENIRIAAAGTGTLTLEVNGGTTQTILSGADVSLLAGNVSPVSLPTPTRLTSSGELRCTTTGTVNFTMSVYLKFLRL